jgi:hypothetical protein
LRTGRTRGGAGNAAVSLAVTGPDAATLPGAGDPSAVKSDCCCASVRGLMGCVGVRRIFMAITPERRAKRICALGVSVLVACAVCSVCSPTHR